VQRQRAEGLATYAAGIAHDINNALSVIVSGLTLVDNRLRPTNTLTEVLDDMHTAVASSSRLAMRMMQLGRMGEPRDHEALEVSPLVNRTAGIMRRSFKPSVLVDVEVPDGLVTRGTEAELHLALMNLLVTAREAMPSGATVTISAHRAALDDERATAIGVAAPGEYVAIVVSAPTTGTDADATAGTGFGLAMSQAIVRQHGGVITDESTAAAGSTFTIWLPAAT
jgi:signal transduction histidine kinase